MQGEIANHEPRIDAVSQTAQKMVEDGHFNSVSNFIPLQCLAKKKNSTFSYFTL